MSAEIAHLAVTEYGACPHCTTDRVHVWHNSDPCPNDPDDAWVNPLVCVCPVPDADPSLRFGECSICRRKPVAS